MDKHLWNLLQQGRGILQLRPMGCLTSRTKAFCDGCNPGDYFECAACGKLQPWCKGAWDDQDDKCDDCWEDTSLGPIPEASQENFVEVL
jgi:hypothetical protein